MKTNNTSIKKRANAYASPENFIKYQETGNEKYLNDVHPMRRMKKGTIYFALGEGWEEKRIK